MQWEVLFGGTGGQGVVLAGVILAKAALNESKYASCMTAYGPEMRGGTANCTTVVSEEEIVTPIIPRPSAVITLNQLSYERFKEAVAPGGILLVNTSLVKLNPCPTTIPDVKVFALPMNDLAMELGNIRVANIVALGAYIRLTSAVKTTSVVEALKDQLGEKKHLIPVNERAIEWGMQKIRDRV